MEIIFLQCIWWTTERTIPRKRRHLARGEGIKIGKAYESTKIKVQKYQCSTNRPSAKESIKAVSKNKPKKVLKCNYCASKMGAHGFSGKKLGPTWGTVYRKWKIKNHCQDSKIDQRSVNNSKKGYKRNTQITDNQNHPQNKHHSPWRPFWPDDYPQVFGESIGKFDGELHLYPSNNVIPHKRALREIPLCVLKNNFVAEVKDLQQQGTLEKVTEPTEWVSAPTVVNCKLSAKNGIRLCIGSRPLNIALKRYEYPNSAVDHLLTEIGNANLSIFFTFYQDCLYH